MSPKWADLSRPLASKLALAIAKILEREGYLCIPPAKRGWGLAKWNTDSAAEVIEVALAECRRGRRKAVGEVRQMELKHGSGCESVIDALFAELRKAEAKFPGWPDDVVHGAAIMAEETGEAVKAALDLYYGRGSREQLWKETAQTGAMAIRLLLYLSHKSALAEPQEGKRV